MINGQNFFDQPVKYNLRTHDNIRKIAIGQGDNYTTGCLLDYIHFHNYYKMTATDLSKQQAYDADAKAIQQINLTKNLNRGQNVSDNATMVFIIKEAKENNFSFSQETVKIS